MNLVIKITTFLGNWLLHNYRAQITLESQLVHTCDLKLQHGREKKIVVEGETKVEQKMACVNGPFQSSVHLVESNQKRS